jgi:hypothetical protein
MDVYSSRPTVQVESLYLFMTSLYTQQQANAVNNYPDNGTERSTWYERQYTYNILYAQELDEHYMVGAYQTFVQ